MEGHIYIYGEITSYQGKDAVNYGAVNPREVQDQIQSNKDAEELQVHINSIGGDVDAGFAIYDILKSSGKKITTVIEGQCYSIATVIALSGSVRKATQNSEFLIHNPWTMAFGDAEDVQKTANELRRFEDKIAEHYASHTTMSASDALEEMKKDTFMDLEKAKEYGFINEIIETVKAVAKYSFKQNKMSDSKKEKGFFDKMKDFFNSLEDEKQEPKNITLKSAIGKDVVFNERTEGDIQKGDVATIDGESPEGEVLMASGDTLVFEGGKLTEIREKEEVDVKALVKDAVAKAIKPFEDKLSEKENEIEALKKANEKNTKIFENLKGIVSDHTVNEKEKKEKSSDAKKEEVKNILSLSNIQNN